MFQLPNRPISASNGGNFVRVVRVRHVPGEHGSCVVNGLLHLRVGLVLVVGCCSVLCDLCRRDFCCWYGVHKLRRGPVPRISVDEL